MFESRWFHIAGHHKLLQLAGPSEQTKAVRDTVSPGSHSAVVKSKTPLLPPPRETIGFVTTGCWSTNHRRGIGRGFCAAHEFLRLQQKAQTVPGQLHGVYSTATGLYRQFTVALASGSRSLLPASLSVLVRRSISIEDGPVGYFHILFL